MSSLPFSNHYKPPYMKPNSERGPPAPPTPTVIPQRPSITGHTKSSSQTNAGSNNSSKVCNSSYFMLKM